MNKHLLSFAIPSSFIPHPSSFKRAPIGTRDQCSSKRCEQPSCCLKGKTIMFDKLVVSSRGRRRYRTSRFFLVTSLVYVFSAACAVALSVFISTPELADISAYQASNLIVPVARLGQPEPRPTYGQPVAAPRADYRNPMPLDQLLSDRSGAPASRVRLTGPPVAESITGDIGDPNGSPFVGGIPGVPGAGQYDDPNSTIGKPPEPDPPAPTLKPQASEPEKKIVRMASMVLQGKAIERPSPAYPPLARAAGVEGPVGIEIVIAPDGRVESARAISGHTLLVDVARETARRWRFEPTLLNGTPVRVIGTITFVFKLRE
jgi:periplasmic protein TonB